MTNPLLDLLASINQTANEALDKAEIQINGGQNE